VRLAPDRSAVAPHVSGSGAAAPGAAPAPGTSPAGVRFQEVTPEWTGWKSEPGPDEAARGRLRALVRQAVEAARPKGRRGDGG
jgi:hypothetical protein